MKLADRLRSIVLTAGAVVGGLCLLAAFVFVVFGIKPLVFMSGSMSPTIPAGGVAFARSVPATDLRPGDIVSVFTSEGARVTHRVVNVNGTGDRRILVLKGDANKTPDAETYPVTAADRVIWSIPYLGYPISFLASPAGLFLLGACAVGVLVMGFGPRRNASGPPGTNGQTRGGHRRGASPSVGRPAILGRKRRGTVAAVPAAAALLVGTAAPTHAAFVDNSVVTSGAIPAATALQVPTNFQCSGGNGVSWSAPASGPSPTSYDVNYVGSGLLGASSGTANVTTTSWTVPSNLLSVGAVYTITVRSHIGTNWVSSYTSTSHAVSVTLILTNCS